MPLKPTMTQGEIPLLVKSREGEFVQNPEYPADGACHSGHCAPLGTRFFAVSGDVVPDGVRGIYCEYCLSVANRMQEHTKRGQPVPFDPDEDLKRLMAKAKND